MECGCCRQKMWLKGGGLRGNLLTDAKPISPCTYSKAAKKKSRNSCAPVWKRSSIYIRRSRDFADAGLTLGSQCRWLRLPQSQINAGVLLEKSRKIIHGGPMAPRLDRARSLLFAWSCDWTLRSGNSVDSIRSGCRRQSRRLGQISYFRREPVVCHSCISCAKATSPVASAQPADRYLRVHRCDPGGPSGHDGARHHLPFCRAVRQFRNHFGN